MRLKKRSRTKQKNTTLKPRIKRQSFLRSPLFFESVIWLTFIGILGGLWYSGIFQKYGDRAYSSYLTITKNSGLQLEHIYVEGLQQLQPETVDRAVNIRKGIPLLAVPLDMVQRRLESLYWVDQATVERQFPHTLHIHIKERRPMALWQNQQRLYLIDHKGDIIPEPHLEPFANLLMIVGEDAPMHSAELFTFLKEEPLLAPQVKAAIRVAKRRWNIRFVNGMEIKLPEINPEVAWKNFAQFNATQKPAERGVSVVDLRVPGKLYIRMHPKQPSNTAMQ